MKQQQRQQALECTATSIKMPPGGVSGWWSGWRMGGLTAATTTANATRTYIHTYIGAAACGEL